MRKLLTSFNALSLQVRLKVFFALTAIALISIIIVYRIAVGSAQNTYETIQASNDIIQQASAVQNSMTKIESMSRAFALTGSHHFLSGYSQEVSKAHSNLRALENLAAGKPAHNLNTEKLREAINKRIAVADELIEIRTLKGLDAASAFTSNNVGKTLSDSINNQLQFITDSEKNILSQSRLVFVARNKYSLVIFIALAVFIVALLTLAAYLIFKNYRLRDVNEKKLNEAHTELMEVNKELESFTYSVSHDLRAPLRAINGYAKMIQEDYQMFLDDEGKKLLNVIMLNSRRMGELIDALLDFSKLGRKPLAVAHVNMREIVYSVIEQEGFGQGCKIHFSVDELPGAYSDKTLIRQAWENLISNAVKYSRGTSEPHIAIGGVTSENKVTFFVRDNGAGFDMAYYDKLFGVFQRLHSQDEFEGTGIGLAMVYKIIRKHGGSVWAESAPGKGATFYFSLPDERHEI